MTRLPVGLEATGRCEDVPVSIQPHRLLEIAECAHGDRDNARRVHIMKDSAFRIAMPAGGAETGRVTLLSGQIIVDGLVGRYGNQFSRNESTRVETRSGLGS